nr:Arc family DNA-binding protein [Halomonas elongata]
MDNRTDPQYKLRMPAELRDRLKDAAKKNHRTMNAEIVARLQESFGPLNEFAREFDDGQPTGLERLFAELDADHHLVSVAEDQHILDLLRTKSEALQSTKQIVASIDNKIESHRRQLKEPDGDDNQL